MPLSGRFTLVSGTRCIRGWVGPRAGLDSYEKSHTALTLGFETPTVQPAAIRYTDYTIPTTTVLNTASQNDEMTTVNKATDYKNFATDVNTC
jgi:hypothetical protein